MRRGTTTRQGDRRRAHLPGTAHHALSRRTSIGTGNAYYYISSTESQTAFLSPKETDRQVVAVYFTPSGSVERVAQYGMKDGKVFDFVSRTTPSANTNDDGLLKQLFRNLGRGGLCRGLLSRRRGCIGGGLRLLLLMLFQKLSLALTDLLHELAARLGIGFVVDRRSRVRRVEPVKR